MAWLFCTFWSKNITLKCTFSKGPVKWLFGSVPYKPYCVYEMRIILNSIDAFRLLNNGHITTRLISQPTSSSILPLLFFNLGFLHHAHLPAFPRFPLHEKFPLQCVARDLLPHPPLLLQNKLQNSKFERRRPWKTRRRRS